MSQVILFDLGNTLVQYYDRPDFPPILKAAIAGASEVVAEKNGMAKDEDGLWKRVEAEKYTAKDFSVRPLEARLQCIFQIGESEWSDELAMAACRGFMKPIFDLARVYDDVLPTLATLRKNGYRTAIVSNTPWGSPASLWREEIARLGLADRVDQAIFCGDCGWRKPARQIFEHTLNLMNAKPEECVFVGDDPRWDIVGPEAAGIKAVLIDRFGRDQTALHSLADLSGRLQAGQSPTSRRISCSDMEITIRPFQPSDEQAVIQLWRDCELVVPQNDPAKDIARKLQFQPELFLVGEQNGQIVATAMAGYEGHRGWINYLAVAPALRRSGVGRRIMDEAEARLRALGCAKINLQVRTSNTEVIAFYERIGYKRDDVVGMGKRLISDDQVSGDGKR